MTSKFVDLKACSFEEWNGIDEGHLLGAALRMEDDCEVEQFFSLLRALGVWLVITDFYAGGDQISGDEIQFFFKAREGLFRVSLGCYGEVEDRLEDYAVDISVYKEDLYELVTENDPAAHHLRFVQTFWNALTDERKKAAKYLPTVSDLFQVQKIGANVLGMIRDWIESDSSDRVYSEFWGGNGSFSACGHTVFLPFNGVTSMYGSGPDYERLSDHGEEQAEEFRMRMAMLEAQAFAARRRYKYALSMKKKKPGKHCAKSAFSAWRAALSAISETEDEFYTREDVDGEYEEFCGSFYGAYEVPKAYTVYEEAPKHVLDFAKEQECALFEEKP